MPRLFPVLLAALLPASAAAADWAHWRGPTQQGVETDAAFPADDAWTEPTWTVQLSGRGTPVAVGDRVYVWGYRGAGPALEQVLAAFDLATGERLWERTWRDFLSDIIYDRYAIGSPTVDAEHGRVFVQDSAGVIRAFTTEGEPLWSVSMMEAYGRLTFPNGRVGAPVLVDGLLVVHFITSSWGAQGPGRDRFFAFDPADGTLVWSSTPGLGPKDSSWSAPLVSELGGRTVLYAGTGSGEVVAVEAATGTPVWRFPMSIGGVNGTPVLAAGGRLVVGHDMENLDSTRTGRIVAIDPAAAAIPPDDGTTPVLAGEVWRLDHPAFSSSPVAEPGGELVYQVTPTGDLLAIDATRGEVVWTTDLAPEQLHASPALHAATGTLVVPMQNGTLHRVRAGREGGQILGTTQLAGSALGAPALHRGMALVLTTERLYAFGTPQPDTVSPAPAPAVELGPPVALRVRPAEVILRPGESVALTADLLDASGHVVRARVPVDAAERFVPPTAKVKARMDATFEQGKLVAAPDATLSAGAWKVRVGGLEGVTRGRVVVGVPYREDFEGEELVVPSPDGPFAWPPLPWIGARFKWEVREREGEQVLAKTLDRMLFQRSTVFLGHPDEHDYTMQVDVLTDGDRRQRSAAGVVHQHYAIVLKANQRVLEVSSNQERLKQSVPFDMQPGVWYRLRTEVVPGEGDARVVRAKAWPRGEAEPDAWTIEVVHPKGHVKGAPGLFGFTPRNLHRVYLDNLVITPAEEAP